MPMSRSQKNVMRSAKSPKSGTSGVGAGTMKASKQYTQTGNKTNPKSASGKNDYDADEMKMIV